MKEIRTLNKDEIEVRVAQIDKNWLTLLLYKNARVDMDVLDETFGCMNWKREHTRDNANCIVSIWDQDKHEWVSKEDTGTESFSEAEKGLASDSFKRACVNIGIGRELYSAPSIFVLPRKDMVKKGKDGEFYQNDKGKYETKTRFYVDYITYDNNRKIENLIIRDNCGNSRFEKLTKETEKKLNTQFMKLKKMIEKAEEIDKDFDREKFYEYFGVTNDSQLNLDQRAEAMKLLEEKYKKGE